MNIDCYLKENHISKFEYRKAKRAVFNHQSKKLTPQKKSPQKRSLPLIVVIALGLLVLGGGVFFFFKAESGKLLNAFNRPFTYYENTVIESQNLSGMTLDEAQSLMADVCDKMLDDTMILFSVDGCETKQSAKSLGITTNVDEVLKKVADAQASMNVFNSLNQESDDRCYTVGFVIDPVVCKENASTLLDPLNKQAVEPALSFDPSAQNEEYITWSPSESGFCVDIDAFVESLQTNVTKGSFDLGEVKCSEVLAQNTQEDFIDTVVQLSEFTTSYANGSLSEENRMYNIAIMAEKTNGSIIEVGENWSLNDTAGPRDEENGFKLAHAIWGGVLTEEYGGGVCQVSSTIYNACLLAELDVVERHAHSRASDYVDIGMDATVNYGVLDLVIQNNLSDRVYIVLLTDQEQKTITAKIYGPKPDHDYQVMVRALLVQSDIQPEDEPEYIAVLDGWAPDGTYVSSGSIYGYPKTKTGCRYKTFKYYYNQSYDEKEDTPYCWVGYEDGDNNSGEKIEVMFVDSETHEQVKEIVTYYPPEEGVYYYHPE